MVRPDSYPSLPVVERREEILAALAREQVLIVCGETGSGKTTQLPKICLEAGRGTAGLIGHTQPRRIAARSVASRIASELGTTVGDAVGFKIRFTDAVSERTRVKLMTDGILLAEIPRDPKLAAYDTLIVDEAHERSLNIDFLLGYLKRLLPERPDLKLVITSATLDPERFSDHFDGAPIIRAEGRTYPVELRYAPPGADEDEGGPGEDETDPQQAVVDACETLLAERRGDVLVFLPGEREIREVADLIGRRAGASKALRGAEVLPLYSRLSNSEQNRVLAEHSGTRIVLATNVAETSLTVPGIRSVIDTGLARVSRYSVRSKVQRLPTERVSQASANQRAGRCGRVAPGVCIRLYDEADFESRPEFTEPEILRTNLAAVILRMSAMRLGRVENFPFVEPPEPRYVNDGYRTLQELAALDGHRRLTPLGRRLARLPVDPRLGRMLLAAADEGCVDEALTIVSALSVQDPRERPFDKREAADALHAEFHDERSDFLSWLNLWSFVTVQKEALSGSRFRKMCRQRFLAPMRVLEWMDVRRQLERLAKDIGLPRNTTEAGPDNVHRALLSGLLANVATKTDERDYLATRNRHVAIFPGSALFRRGPKWIMAAEIAETRRLWARTVGAIRPEWIERAAEHLLQYSYRDPCWHRKRGTVVASAQVTLFGLVVNPRKRVDYAPINPVESRRIFLREALVGGALATDGRFLEHNRALLEEVGALEEKSRRRDIVVAPEELERFYDAVVPEGICTAVAFEAWRREHEREQPRALHYEREQLIAGDAASVSERDYPDRLETGGTVLPLRYRFAPGEEDDGVTLVCPVELINRVSPERCEWLVPGMIEEKITLLIKALPKHLRRNFVPAPDFARAVAEAASPEDGALVGALSYRLQRMTGIEVPRAAWDESVLPDHLRMRFELLDADGAVVAAGRDLEALQASHAGEVERTLLRFSDGSIERDSVTDWNFGDLAESVDMERGGVTVRGWPALEATADGVGVRLFADEAAARAAMPLGVRALYRQVLREEVRYLRRKLPGIDVLALRFAPFGDKRTLIEDVIDAALDACFVDPERLPRTREAFLARLAVGRERLVATADGIAETLAEVLERHREVARRVEGSIPLSWIEAVGDIRDQIDALLYPGFVTATGVARLARLPVYFRAMDRRLDGIDRAPDRDRRRRAELLPVWEAFKTLPALPADPDYEAARQALRWSFEELRVSLFAQELGTIEKVSVARLESRVAELRGRVPRLRAAG